jgi:hypothetical protein
MKVVSLSALCTDRLYPQEIYLVLIYVGTWGSVVVAASRRVPGSNPGVVTWDFFRGASDGTMCTGVDSASKNEYHSPGGEGGRCVELTTNHPSSAERQEIWDLNLPGTPRAPGGLLREYLYLLLIYVRG